MGRSGLNPVKWSLLRFYIKTYLNQVKRFLINVVDFVNLFQVMTCQLLGLECVLIKIFVTSRPVAAYRKASAIIRRYNYGYNPRSLLERLNLY